MKVLKRIGIILLLLVMAYASNWDAPKETMEDWERAHAEELQAYHEAKEVSQE